MLISVLLTACHFFSQTFDPIPGLFKVMIVQESELVYFWYGVQEAQRAFVKWQFGCLAAISWLIEVLMSVYLLASQSQKGRKVC